MTTTTYTTERVLDIVNVAITAEYLAVTVLTAAVKIYAAKVERRGHDVAPFAPGSVTATETVVTACGMIRAADLNMFDVAIWFHRPPGIE